MVSRRQHGIQIDKRELKKIEIETKPRSAGDGETGGGPAGVVVVIGAAVLAWWRGSWTRGEEVPAGVVGAGHGMAAGSCGGRGRAGGERKS
jgi:hypothetical protein